MKYLLATALLATTANAYPTPYVTDCYPRSSHEWNCFVETQGGPLLKQDLISMLPNHGEGMKITMHGTTGATTQEHSGRNTITVHYHIATLNNGKY